MSTELKNYADLLSAVKIRIRQARTKAVLSANAEMILMYWDISKLDFNSSKKKTKNLPQRVAKTKDNVILVILQNFIAKIPLGLYFVRPRIVFWQNMHCVIYRNLSEFQIMNLPALYRKN